MVGDSLQKPKEGKEAEWPLRSFWKMICSWHLDFWPVRPALDVGPAELENNQLMLL